MGDIDLSKLKTLKPGTVEMEQYLAVGYPDIGTVAKAKAIIEERGKNPALWPYEMAEKAQAFLAAYNGKVQVISNRPGYRPE